MNGAPDLTQAVIGYRAWSVNSEGQLCSAGHAQVPWHEVEERAVCRKQPYLGVTEHTDHDPAETPSKDCSCGIYAWHAIHPSWTTNGYYSAVRGVYGAIAAAGRLEVHHGGFRAERARVVCLAFDPEWPWRWVKDLEDVALARRIALVPLADLVHEARRHGGEVPEDMRPEAPEGTYGQVFHNGGYIGYGISLAATPGSYQTAVGTYFHAASAAIYSPQSYHSPSHYSTHLHHGTSFAPSRRDEIGDEIRTLRRAITTARPWQSRQRRELERKIRELKCELRGL